MLAVFPASQLHTTSGRRVDAREAQTPFSLAGRDCAIRCPLERSIVLGSGKCSGFCWSSPGSSSPQQAVPKPGGLLGSRGGGAVVVVLLLLLTLVGLPDPRGYQLLVQSLNCQRELLSHPPGELPLATAAGLVLLHLLRLVHSPLSLSVSLPPLVSVCAPPRGEEGGTPLALLTGSLAAGSAHRHTLLQVEFWLVRASQPEPRLQRRLLGHGALLALGKPYRGSP